MADVLDDTDGLSFSFAGGQTVEGEELDFDVAYTCISVRYTLFVTL